jgi:hypothetical protein
MSAAVAQHVVTSAIVANIPIAILSEITGNQTLERLDLALLVFFTAEVLCRFARAARRRQWDLWLAFDAIIVALAVLPFGVIPVVRAARLVHLSRHCAHLRHHLTNSRLARVV